MNSGEDWTQDTGAEAERAIGYTFSDKRLLKTVFTHPTYRNLHGGEDNDRLEFLGDAVLQILVSEKIFFGRTDGDAGKMTKLRQQYVSQEALTEAEARAGLMRFMRYAGTRENLDGKTNSNLFEAVVAAVYLDGGREQAKRFLFAHLKPADTRNFVGDLQEYVQSKIKKPPEYVLEGERNGTFYFSVSALGKQARGEGTSKQIAKAQAARALLSILQGREGI